MINLRKKIQPVKAFTNFLTLNLSVSEGLEVRMDILAQKGGGLVLQLFHSPHLNINSQQVHKTFLSILYLRILCQIQGKPLIYNFPTFHHLSV